MFDWQKYFGIRFKREWLSNLMTRDELERLSPSEVLLIAHDVDRGYTFEGKAYSHLVDSVGDLLTAQKKSHLTLATPFSKLTDQLAYGNVIAANGLFARALLKRFLFNKIFGQEPQICAVTAAWQLILKKVKPLIVLGIQPSKELCIAAKELGIPTYDLQHGVMTNLKYYSPEARASTNQSGWPDAILCWDKSSAEVVTRLGGLSQPIVVGHPWLSRFTHSSKSDGLVSFANLKFRFSKRTPKILVTLTHGLSSFDAKHSLIGITEPIIKLILDKQIPCEWLIRMHPVQMRRASKILLLKNLKSLFGHLDNVEWENASAAPLPLVLRQSSAHITCFSSVAIEAAYFGIRTAFIAEDEQAKYVKNFYNSQLNSGLAKILRNDCQCIKDWLVSNMTKDGDSKDLILNFNLKPILRHFDS